jgi:mannose-6-phosphate isomerase-like protein (cupin superfamily)
MMTYLGPMKLIKRTEAPVFSAAGTTVTAYAAPSRGASEVSIWQIELAPGSTSPLHHMDCEEVFVGLHGHAVATIGEIEHPLGPGDCLILPAATAFTLHVPGEEPFRAMACIPVGGQATMVPDGPTFAPPWTA